MSSWLYLAINIVDLSPYFVPYHGADFRLLDSQMRARDSILENQVESIDDFYPADTRLP